LTGSDALGRLRHFSNLHGIKLRNNSLTGLNGFELIKKDFPKLIELGLWGDKHTCAESIVNSLQSQNVTVRVSEDVNGDYKWMNCV